MRLGRVVNATNWKYAIGEIVLIVVGVTIALAANSWYAARQERSDEIQVLRQLKQALQVDLAEFESWHSQVTWPRNSLTQLLEKQ